jgi:hypothetical protein
MEDSLQARRRLLGDGVLATGESESQAPHDASCESLLLSSTAVSGGSGSSDVFCEATPFLTTVESFVGHEQHSFESNDDEICLVSELRNIFHRNVFSTFYMPLPPPHRNVFVRWALDD